MTQVEIQQAVESIWTLFRETDRRLDQRVAETDQRLDQRIAETDRRLDRRFEATEREIAALSAQTRAVENLFTSQWGRLLEALVEPGVVELFQAWGIAVNRSLERPRVRRGGEELEIDLLLVNGDALVVVEVKSTLRVKDVRKFLEDLKKFPEFFPEYRGYRLFGAVAALGIDESADRYAYRQGLFVLTLGREGLVTLRNDSGFRPKDFAADDSVGGSG
ncbi:DUF3782 domain-containing protein [Candidatus Thiosymbion oneisti]|uniref:DUF3782 domain-containing protein n=1 Tax=Candidatus Thiosymbion oneisti TaxID=589554 RepID=UPI000A7886BA|nr:DUF3782 domain-containing protein [Candidatus Thiosymbion oneisti]